MPNHVWIWEVTSLSLFSVAVQLKPVKHFAWSPSNHILAIATENSKIYILTLDDASVCDIPIESKLNIGMTKCQWNVDGKSFLISEKNYVFIGHPLLANKDDEENQNEGDEQQNYYEGNRTNSLVENSNAKSDEDRNNNLRNSSYDN